MAQEAGWEAKDFSKGGFTRGRLSNINALCEIPKDDKGNTRANTGVMVVFHGRDAAGQKQQLWFSLGGDAKESNERYKPGPGGKSILLRKEGDQISASCKWAIFLASLRDPQFTVGKEKFNGVGFPMSRLTEARESGKGMLTAFDGCTFDIDSRPMELSPQILASMARENKSVPLVYFATAFELPGGASDADADDDEEDVKPKPKAETPEALVEKYVRAALVKADGDAVPLKALQDGLAKKFADHAKVDDIVEVLTPGWLAGLDGVSYSKKEKTVSAE